MLFQQAKQWRLDPNPVEHNEYYKLELLELGNLRAATILSHVVREKDPKLFLMKKRKKKRKEKKQ